MDYEKLYKEALEKAKIFKKHLLEINDNGYAEEIDYIFPELKESEDEKIKKEIIRIVDGYFPDKASTQRGKYITWLEKQGEQKPINNIEPKFKVGDWVMLNENHNSIYQVEKIENYHYVLRHILGGAFSEPFGSENSMRLWTIQDAKDGDVLFTSSTASYDTFIFKSIDEEGNAKCYFAYDSEDGFREGTYHFIGRAINCKPATKEQCELLFQKMKEKGYEWDANKKEIHKLYGRT